MLKKVVVEARCNHVEVAFAFEYETKKTQEKWKGRLF
jgi:predicted GIY-YIG superfamily endonuclease